MIYSRSADDISVDHLSVRYVQYIYKYSDNEKRTDRKRALSPILRSVIARMLNEGTAQFRERQGFPHGSKCMRAWGPRGGRWCTIAVHFRNAPVVAAAASDFNFQVERAYISHSRTPFSHSILILHFRTPLSHSILLLHSPPPNAIKGFDLQRKEKKKNVFFLATRDQSVRSRD